MRRVIVAIRSLGVTLLATAIVSLWLLADGPIDDPDPTFEQCPKIVTADGNPLEPSGLVWAEDLHVAIAVNDERDEAPGYEIFAFDPNKKTPNNKIVAQPLLTKSISDTFQLDDLESITRLDNKVFYAFCSLSLDYDEAKSEDRWSRHQAVGFDVGRRADGGIELKNLHRLSGVRRPDMREWMMSSSSKSWKDESYRKRAERGGINVEGLASSLDGSLVIGFRGPLEDSKIPVLFLKPPEDDQSPEAVRWTSIDNSKLPGGGEEKERGIRAIERIPGAEGPERYVAVLGHTGHRQDSLRIVIWEPESGALKDYGELPKRFVGEGVAVMGPSEGAKLKLLIVSDLGGRVLVKTITP